MNMHDNILLLNERIEKACSIRGIKRSEITVVAAAKTFSGDIAAEVLKEGISDIGENYVQELLEKYDAYKENGAKIHLIGHLQTNKVKSVIGKTSLIQSLDSGRLAAEINKQSAFLNIVTDTLLEVNISGEESKFGINPKNIGEMLDFAETLPFLRIKGLMAMAPFSPLQDEAKTYFKNLYKIFVDIRRKKYNNSNMEYLSMGMSNDFESAIIEGSNMIRIGSLIYGQRKYIEA